MKPVRFLRATYFIWLIMPVLLFALYATYGLPHLRWSYSWRDDGQGYDPYASRFYTRCVYIGVSAQFTVFPPAGKCPLVMMSKPDGWKGSRSMP